MIATALVWALAFPPPGPRYSELPEPCTLIGLATVNTFLPGALASQVSTAAPSHGKAASCGWASARDREDRSVGALVEIFSSSSAITDAQQDYDMWVSTIGHNKGIAASTRPVAGLGDRATALLLTARSAADFAAVVNANADPGAYLVVWSSNAVLVLNYGIVAVAGGATQVPTPGGAQLPDLISMARAILSSLAQPATVSSAPGAPSSPRVPHYAGRRDPCRLITAATLATYAAGATVSPVAISSPPGSAQMNSCSWGTTSPSPYVELTLTLFPDYASAQQGFTSQLQTDAQSASGMTVTGGQFLAGLGDEAADIFQSRSGAPAVELLVGSGNAVIDLSYTGPGAQSPDHAVLLAGGIAMARDALAALASTSASSYRQGPVYAQPSDLCQLIRVSTVDRYLPGATVSVDNATSLCDWISSNQALTLEVTIDSDLDSAQGDFERDVQFNQGSQSGSTFDGAQSVKSLGMLATATFQTSIGAPGVELDIWSGNAVIEINVSDLSTLSFLGPVLSHGAELADGVALARDVLANLPR